MQPIVTPPARISGAFSSAEFKPMKPCVAAFFLTALLLTTLLLGFAAKLSRAQSPAERPPDEHPADVLTPDQWRRTDAAVERALAWLASTQQSDGSFPTIPSGQPGVTALGILAFMSHGHVPGVGPYGDCLTHAVDFVASCQKQNGLLAVIGPDGPKITRAVDQYVGVTTAYNHAIGSLVLSEVYGVSDDAEREQHHEVIERALAATLAMQRWPKDHPKDNGGWRYIYDHPNHESDLSITGWSLMFLRSSKNAGFDVPEGPIDDAVAYVRRCFNDEYQVFEYVTGRPDDDRSRGMAGAGIIALAHAGYHGADEATKSGDWILEHDFSDYNLPMQFSVPDDNDRYHYSLFNCCQGMYQLGGRHWRQFFPPVVETLLKNQQADGSWPTDAHAFDAQFGNAYTTAMVLMALGAPNQLLPVFQR
jgi:hypothetical protein